MSAGEILREARRAARLSQRGLAERAHAAQPAIARIERGRVVPGFGTLEHLLRACGCSVEVVKRHGTGIDRTVMRGLLRLSPRERLDLAVAEAKNVRSLLEQVKK